jgi:hypothetical protein
MSSPECVFCKKQFSSKSNLTKHLHSCKRKDFFEYESRIQTLKEQYERELQTQKEQYERELQTQKEQYERELQMARKHIEKLENQIFEIAKQPTINHMHNTTKHTTNNNQKTLNIINQLAPYDLTVERVEEILSDYNHILEKVFGNGPSGIADFIVEKILIDSESQKPKLVATDRSRGVFKYKDSDGNIHIDHKLKKTTDILQKPLLQANDQVFTEIYERQDRELDNTLRNTFNENSDLLNGINKHKLGAQLSRRLENETNLETNLETN